MYGYIYRITDLTNGKMYFGQHKYDKPMLDPYYHGSGDIIVNIRKIRPETLLEEYWMTCETAEEMDYFEEYFIEHCNTMVPNGYNITKGGDRGPVHFGEDHWLYGKTHTEETKQKISDSVKKLWQDSNYIENTNATAYWFQKGHTPEHKFEKGHIPWNKGLFGELNPQARRSRKSKFMISKEELYNLYVVQGLSTIKIAKMYGCNSETIRYKLKKYNIKK